MPHNMPADSLYISLVLFAEGMKHQNGKFTSMPGAHDRQTTEVVQNYSRCLFPEHVFATIRSTSISEISPILISMPLLRARRIVRQDSCCHSYRASRFDPDTSGYDVPSRYCSRKAKNFMLVAMFLVHRSSRHVLYAFSGTSVFTAIAFAAVNPTRIGRYA
jgi:hypothetical protein